MPVSHHILVVDDDDSVRSTVSVLLSRRGYAVSAAENGQDALTILKEQEIDLVILDVELGDENGLSLLATMKANAPQTRVIILTGRGYEEKLWQEARRNGADGYMSKTLSPSQLVMEVNRVLKHQATPEGSPSPGPSL